MADWPPDGVHFHLKVNKQRDEFLSANGRGEWGLFKLFW